MVAISIMASISSSELKKGNRRERMVSSITPADQMSILVVCSVHLKRTSGARNPRVPARLALRDGRESFFGYPDEGPAAAATLFWIRRLRSEADSMHRHGLQSVPWRSANPKSTSTPRRFVGSYRKFVGLMSRWRTPCSCTAAKAVNSDRK